MKKFSFLFVVLALMSIVCSAFAEIDLANLPAIDEEAAADYLGKWYMTKMCFGDACMPIGETGNETFIELESDNDMVFAVTNEEEPTSIIKWYMEDGVAKYAEVMNEGEEPVVRELSINEKGELVMGDAEVSIIYTRESPVNWGKGEVKADAELEDYLGEWYLYAMSDDEMTVPVALLGMTGKLTVKEDMTFDLEMDEGQYKDNPFELAEGKMSGVMKDEEDGKEDQFTAVYHVEGSVVMTINMNEDGAGLGLVFVREENMPAFNLGALMDLENIEVAEPVVEAEVKPAE
ncbi:MAG: hypothetical protein IJI57_01120 [Flexilinea sp.]|nr:hypothetical protein [Flexilinea sp.]